MKRIMMTNHILATRGGQQEVNVYFHDLILLLHFLSFPICILHVNICTQFLAALGASAKCQKVEQSLTLQGKEEINCQTTGHQVCKIVGNKLKPSQLHLFQLRPPFFFSSWKERSQLCWKLLRMKNLVLATKGTLQEVNVNIDDIFSHLNIYSFCTCFAASLLTYVLAISCSYGRFYYRSKQ